jgi:exopolyphosphatase/guanosine-5'-triphosphate,3'-diphosphate pyrophosphatase
LAAGPDEDPAVALSLPLGVGRLTRERFDGDPPSKAAIGTLAEHLAARLAKPGKRLLAGGAPDRVVGTSKTFRTLARLAGAAPSSAGPRVERTLSRTGLSQVTAFVARMASADLAELDGVSPARAHQVLAGALVAAATMDALAVEVVELCPWALREGVILQQLDWLGVG